MVNPNISQTTENTSPMQDKLLEIVTQIQSGIMLAKDFAVEQLPDIAQSYVMYGRVSVTFGFITALLALIAGIFGIYYFSVKRKDTDNWGNWLWFRTFGTMMSGLFSFVFAFVASLSASNFFLVWFAPKVWLLKEIATMLK